MLKTINCYGDQDMIKMNELVHFFELSVYSHSNEQILVIPTFKQAVQMRDAIDKTITRLQKMASDIPLVQTLAIERAELDKYQPKADVLAEALRKVLVKAGCLTADAKLNHDELLQMAEVSLGKIWIGSL